MFCPHCGTQLPDDARFCGSCGTPLQKSQSAPKATPASVPSKPKKDKKDGKKVLIVTVSILLVLAIAAGAIAAWQLFFSKETVYLWVASSSYTEGNPMKNNFSREYDMNGNLLRYERFYDYSDEYEAMGSTDVKFEVSYEYEDDVLTGLEITQNEQFYQLAYTYEKGVLVDIELVESSQDDDLEVEIDDEGRILELVLLKDDIEINSYKFDYDENGAIREKETSYTISSGYRNVMEFDEQGNATEQTTYINGEVMSRVVYVYSDKGALLEMSQYGMSNELAISMKFVPEYDADGKMTELEISIKDDSGKGSLFFEAEYDGLELTLTPVKATGNFDDRGYPRRPSIQVTYDEAGNITETRIYKEGELYMENIIEFKEFKVPKDYRKISPNDPFWFPLGS